MPRGDHAAITLRFVVERPVVGVAHSLQAKDGGPLDPQRSRAGEPIVFDVPVRVAPGPRFLGDQVRREGVERRFVYIRIGDLAGDPASPWSRRMKIDIHDMPQALLDEAMRTGRAVETVVAGTGADGTPACATLRPLRRGLAAR